MYDREADIVLAAVASLRSESDKGLILELEREQAAAATGLEYYGITKSVFERFLKNNDLKEPTRRALKRAIKAVVTMYTK